MLPALIVGCGYLGKRIARQWLDLGRPVAALTRNRETELAALGVTPIRGDLMQPDSLKSIPPVGSVVYCVAPERATGNTFREVYLDGLRHLLDSIPVPEKFLLVSSTSVYGQHRGEIVDETSPTEPAEANGITLLEAEALLQARIPQAVILRFAGIYGPDRLIRRAALEKGDPLVGDPEKWLNLIHVEDGARAVIAAEAHAPEDNLCCVCDNRPIPRREFYTCMAELLKAPPAKFTPLPPGSPPPPHDRANRRVNNARLRSIPGMELKFPDCFAGLRGSLAAMGLGGEKS